MARKNGMGKKKTPPATGALGQFEYVVEVMVRKGLAEVEWQSGEERFRVVLSHGHSAASMAQPKTQVADIAPVPPFVPLHQAQPAATPKMSAKQKQILSPFVGTFYRSPSPESEPYVRDGQTVKRGDVLCIVEAMKLMNEIDSEFSGKIISCLVENGQPVEFGEPLFIFEP